MPTHGPVQPIQLQPSWGGVNFNLALMQPPWSQSRCQTRNRRVTSKVAPMLRPRLNSKKTGKGKCRGKVSSDNGSTSHLRPDPHSPRSTGIYRQLHTKISNQNKWLTREVWCMYTHQALHTVTRDTVQGGGDSDRISKWSAWIPRSLEYPDLILILYPQQTNNLIQLVRKNKNRTADEEYGQHHSQPISRTRRGPKEGYSDFSSVAAPNWHHHWFKSDRNRCKSIP